MPQKRSILILTLPTSPTITISSIKPLSPHQQSSPNLPVNATLGYSTILAVSDVRRCVVIVSYHLKILAYKLTTSSQTQPTQQPSSPKTTPTPTSPSSALKSRSSPAPYDLFSQLPTILECCADMGSMRCSRGIRVQWGSGRTTRNMGWKKVSAAKVICLHP